MVMMLWPCPAAWFAVAPIFDRVSIMPSSAKAFRKRSTRLLDHPHFSARKRCAKHSSPRASSTLSPLIRATVGFQAAFSISHTHASRREYSSRANMRSEEHTSELQSLMRISYAVFCLKKKKNKTRHVKNTYH